MTRKRAIKLLMAAGGNGQGHVAATLLDMCKKKFSVDNREACYMILYRIRFVAVGNLDIRVSLRTDRIIKKEFAEWST